MNKRWFMWGAALFLGALLLWLKHPFLWPVAVALAIAALVVLQMGLYKPKDPWF